jgi:cell division protein ZapA
METDGKPGGTMTMRPDRRRGDGPKDAGAPGAESVSVEIYDQIYHLRGTDAEHIDRLATLVDAKMRAVAAHGSTVDSLRVAVLAALNIADELLALRERYEETTGNTPQAEDSMSSRAGTLAGILDELLEDRRAG